MASYDQSSTPWDRIHEKWGDSIDIDFQQPSATSRDLPREDHLSWLFIHLGRLIEVGPKGVGWNAFEAAG